MIIHKIHPDDHEEILIKTGLGILLAATKTDESTFIMRAAHSKFYSYVVNNEGNKTNVYLMFGGTQEERVVAYQSLLKELMEDNPGGQIISDHNVGVKDYFNQGTNG